MAVTISWSTTAPTVDSWSTATYTSAYHLQNDNANWYARVGFSIGRITGTRNFAVRAVCQGHRASGWQPQGPNITPRVTVEGTTKAGSGRSGTVDTTNWTALGSTQYAVVTGAKSKATVTGADNHSNKVTMTSPISAPQISLTIGGAWVQSDAVFVYDGAAWIEADAAFVHDGTDWREA